MAARRLFGWKVFHADLAAIVFWLAALSGTAQAQDLPDQQPFLRIEPGMHTASIQRIGVDTVCSLMVTGSYDKTARLWRCRKAAGEAPSS